MRQIILMAAPAVFLAGGAFAQGSGDTPCDPAVVTLTGFGAWDYDTSVGTTQSGIDTVGNACNSAAPPPPATTDGLHFDRWFLWTSPASGNIIVDTCATTNAAGGPIINYDTKVAVYESSGNCMDITTGSGLFIVCGEDGPDPPCANFSTQLTAGGIVAGQDYWIQVGGWSLADIGASALTIAQGPPAPPNDDCGSATPISGEGTFPFDSMGASTDGSPDPLCNFFGVDQVWNDVWYSWTSTTTGTFRIETCNLTGLDTKLAIYDDQPCAPMNALLCNDDNCPNATFQSSFDFPAIAGTTYLIRLGSFGATATGVGDVLIVNVGGPPDIGNNVCTSLPNSTGVAATVAASGSDSVMAQQLILTSSGLPPGVNGIHYYGTNSIQLLFGDGFRCVGGITQRLPFNSADAAGTMIDGDVFALPMANLPIVAGTLYFQGWYRDPMGPLGTGFNLTDSVEITFVP